MKHRKNKNKAYDTAHEYKTIKEIPTKKYILKEYENVQWDEGGGSAGPSGVTLWNSPLDFVPVTKKRNLTWNKVD